MNHSEPNLFSASKSRSILLPSPDVPYAQLLGGPPETAGMRSGCVVLSPGESVGLHSTNENEEFIVPLSGTGQLHVPGVGTFEINAGCVLYNPPNTPHDVTNTGDQPLRYIYIVARA